MSEAEARSFLTRFRVWLDEDARNMEHVAEFLIERATGGHFGYFRLLVDLVDGNPHEWAANELTGEASCSLIVVDTRHLAQNPKGHRAAA